MLPRLPNLRGAVRFLPGHAVGGEIRGALLEMKAHLLGHLVLRPPAVEKVAEAAGDPAEGNHGYDGSGYVVRPIASPAR